MTINKHIFTLLKEHVTSRLGGEAHCTVRTSVATRMADQDIAEEGKTLSTFFII